MKLLYQYELRQLIDDRHGCKGVKKKKGTLCAVFKAGENGRKKMTLPQIKSEIQDLAVEGRRDHKLEQCYKTLKAHARRGYRKF